MGRLDNGALKEKVTKLISSGITQLRALINNNSSDRFISTTTTQAFRSLTSIGANLAEADVAITKKEFRRILCISLREASETRYWFKIMKNDLNLQIDESFDVQILEVIKILKTIVGKTTE